MWKLAVAGFLALTGYAHADYVTQKGAVMCPSLIALQEVAAHAKAGQAAMMQALNDQHCFVAKEGIVVELTSDEGGQNGIKVSIRASDGQFHDYWTVRRALREQ